MNLEEAQEYFNSQKFQDNYNAYMAMTIQNEERVRQAEVERKRINDEYLASPQYLIDVENKRKREERREIIEDVKKEVMKEIAQSIHDAMVEAGANCNGYCCE